MPPENHTGAISSMTHFVCASHFAHVLSESPKRERERERERKREKEREKERDKEKRARTDRAASRGYCEVDATPEKHIDATNSVTN